MSTDTTEQLQDLAQSPAEEAVQAPAKTSSISPDELARLSDDVVAALKTVYDPEIPADIFELGLSSTRSTSKTTGWSRSS